MIDRLACVAALAVCTSLAACSSRPTPLPAAKTAASSAPAVATVSKEQCATLAHAQIEFGTIETADVVPRGQNLYGLKSRLLIKVFWWDFPGLHAPMDFCRVTAKLRPVPGSEITVEAWLPGQWNGRLLGNGGGGFNGSLGFAGPLLMTEPLSQGYMTFVTDAGHEETETAEFVHDSRERFIDFAYRANHVATVFTKALAQHYYGLPARRAYFQGCSNGGRDALMLAWRFPDDYDGIIAGAPAASWSRLSAALAWNYRAVHGTPGAPKLGKKLRLIQDAAIARCDALDGVKDQVLENPSACTFDPAELQCKSIGDENCLDADEVTAVRKIYAGPRLRDGTQVSPGMPPGGEAQEHGWDDWFIHKKKGGHTLARETFRWMVYDNPDWNIDQFDVDRDYPKAAERIGPIMDADNPDIGTYVRRGGKLLLWHGWNDPAISPGVSLDYYAAVRRTLGEAAERQVRLFMVPGMTHCFGGSGPAMFDRLDTLDRWVESGVAPERIIATQYDPPAVLMAPPDARVVRTRPLCAWPKVARYDGSGSSDDEANFRCE